MPYLNWKDGPLQMEVTHEEKLKTQLLLQINTEEKSVLVSHLGEVLLQGGRELRHQLPQKWVLYWKRREDGSRALLAHPSQEEWVGTIALDPLLAEKLIEALTELKEGFPLKLSEMGSLSSFSNLDLIIKLGK